MLFDHELNKANLDPDAIRGYDAEEYTHMAVAVSVLSGKADSGLGILAAARALGLDFVPVTEERYDLVIPVEFLELQSIQEVLTIIATDEFKQAVEQKGGYSTRQTGDRVI